MGILDSIGTFLGDKENRLNLASGFAGMSGNPNAANIQQGYQNRLEALRDDRKLKTATDLAATQATTQRNSTAEMLLAMGGEYAKVGEALLAKQIDGAQAWAEFSRLKGEKPATTFEAVPAAEITARGLDPALRYQKDLLGKIHVIGANGTSVKVINEAPLDTNQSELFKTIQKGGGEQVNAYAQGYEQARASLGSIETLQQLGAIMDTTTKVPGFIRDKIGEGYSGTIDAYNATARGVAQSMRVPGSGPMTDNDFRILVSRAGSASMNPDARMVIQSGLRAAAQRRMDLGEAAMAFQLNATAENRTIYQDKVKEIQNRPLFTEEERTFLNSFGPKVDSSSIDQSHKTYFEQLPKSKQARFAAMSPATKKAFVDAWLSGQVGN